MSLNLLVNLGNPSGPPSPIRLSSIFKSRADETTGFFPNPEEAIAETRAI